MRITIVASVLLASAGLVQTVHAESKRPLATLVRIDPPKPRTLAAGEIQERIKGANDDIGRCYLDAAGDVRGAGRLEVTLAIHRSGTVESIGVATPKLSAKRHAQIDGCVRARLAATTFPARRAPTTAVIPYFYQRTAAPGAGPQYSCWNPEGCPDR